MVVVVAGWWGESSLLSDLPTDPQGKPSQVAQQTKFAGARSNKNDNKQIIIIIIIIIMIIITRAGIMMIIDV